MKKKQTLMEKLAESLHYKDKARIRKIVYEYEGDLNVNERNALVSYVYKESLMNNPQIENVIKAVNYVTRHGHTRNAIKQISKAMRESIFVVCSWHKSPAKDHKDFQGKIYIDENWKNRVKSESLINKIQNFINENNIKTIQEVVNSPVYLCVRPNCKHILIPISIKKALNKPVREFLKETPNGISFSRNLSDRERYKRFKRIKDIYKKTL